MSITWPTPVFFVSTSDVFAVTVICSLMLPTVNVTLSSGFDLEHDAVANVRVETLKDHLQLVRSHRQVGKCIRPILRREDGARHASIGFRDGDFGPGDRSVARITDSARQLRTGNRLCPGRAGCDEAKKDDADE